MNYKIIIVGVVFAWLLGLTVWLVGTNFSSLDRDIEQTRLLSNLQDKVVVQGESLKTFQDTQISIDEKMLNFFDKTSTAVQGLINKTKCDKECFK